jgi:thiol-disulfide isomerase/thioredoxin
MRNRLVFALLILVLLSWSCEAACANELRQFVRGSWNDIRKVHAGKPTVVHFWGVTCGPCRIEMPNWGKLLAERPDLNLVVINADLVPNELGAVTGMLAETGLAAAENWTFGDGFVERLR